MREEKKVRKATVLDLLALTELASRYEGQAKMMQQHKLDVPTFMNNIAMGILVESGYVSVLISGNRVVGAFWGCLTTMPWSAVKIAQDICFFVDEGCRGYGNLLIRDWIKWAESQGASEVCLSSASGIETDRAQRLFKKHGFTKQGDAYSRRLDNELK